MPWDSPLAAVTDLVAACADHDSPDAGPDAPQIAELIVGMPIELSINSGPEGRVEIAAAPPRQACGTSVMPVLHHIRLRLEVTR